MQLDNAAEGHEHNMSTVHPVWSSSTSTASDNRSPVDAYGQFKHCWPSQAYHCTFCTRVFRTAQALGGHMNIHRRERASANDVITHNHIPSATSTLSTPGRFPASIAEPAGLPLFPASHRLLMPSRSPPPSTNSMASSSSISYMENCYASARLSFQPRPSNYIVANQLHQASANFAPVPADRASLTDHQPPPAVGCNVGYGKLDVANQPRSVNSNISDPLTWLFSQLPPPGALATFQQHNSACRSNILMQRNLTKPYHRALAVSKAPPGARRHVCRSSLLFGHLQSVQYKGMQSRCRMVETEGASSSSAAMAPQPPASAGEDSLDLELRL